MRVDDSELMRDLSSHGVKVTGVIESNFWKDAAGWLIPLLVLGFIWMIVLRRVGQTLVFFSWSPLVSPDPEMARLAATIDTIGEPVVRPS